MSHKRSSGDRELHSPAEWRYHLSVDDVFESLVHVADSGCALLEQSLFAQLASLHDRFGTGVDVYVFNHGQLNGRSRSLAEVPSRLQPEFHALPWLRVAPHGENYEEPPFGQSVEKQLAMFRKIYQEIERFAGSQANSQWLRLHCFSECYEAAPFLCERGVESLLLTDREAVAYRLDTANRKWLELTGAIQHKGLTLRRSFPRIETMVAEAWDLTRIESAFVDRLQSHGYLALFTHEVELEREDVRDMTTRCLEVLEKLGAASRCQ